MKLYGPYCDRKQAHAHGPRNILFNGYYYLTEKELYVYEELRKGEKSHEFKVFIKEEFPPNSHYALNENVQELIVVANEGYAFTFDTSQKLDDLKSKRVDGNSSEPFGMTGYNNTYNRLAINKFVHQFMKLIFLLIVPFCEAKRFPYMDLWCILLCDYRFMRSSLVYRKL